MKAIIRVATLLLIVCAATPLPAQAPVPGKSIMSLRGNPQDLYFYPCSKGATDLPVILFLPGDGGWRGFAVDMAKAIAAGGYEVYGWDVKKYLMGFTGKTTLTESEMAADVQSAAEWIGAQTRRRVILVGWSQGAGMAVLATASHERRQVISGVVTIGLPEAALLGWKMADDLTYITRKEPNEPTFSTLQHLPKITLPLAMIFSTRDEYVTTEAAMKLFSAAQRPKRYFTVEARSHKYDGNRDDFFRALREAVRWIVQPE